ncbi:MAG: acetolactate decarboxylase [Candidatus Bathyarchaeia archaeon]|jgi:acetolactate decarboxylase
MQQKNKGFLLIIIALVGAVSGTLLYSAWTHNLETPTPTQEGGLFQIAPFNTFAEGNYEGNLTFAELSKQGDFGIGTLNGLDGEMIALDGVFYQIPADGTPRQISPTEKTPYATVTFFRSDQTAQVTGLNYSQLSTYLDGLRPSEEAIYAIKVQGTFDYALTRSPQIQTQPYPNLTEALKTQSIFTLNEVNATAAGFWFPSSMSGPDYAGYHLHLITDDATAGGHLLDCIIKDATVEIDQINTYKLEIP